MSCVRLCVIAASLRAERVRCLEAHGSGTRLGDPVEAEAAARALCLNVPRTHGLVVGTCKSAVGHAEGAAGIAGLLKAHLMLKQRIATPNAQLRTPNPLIVPFLAPKQLHLPTAPTPLRCDANSSGEGATLCLGVSAFGFGGSNAHALLAAEVPRSEARGAKVGVQQRHLRRLLPTYSARRFCWREERSSANGVDASALASRLTALPAATACVATAATATATAASPH
eukprot:2120095-Pleurochrysis_carterae.AAC.3